MCTPLVTTSALVAPAVPLMDYYLDSDQAKARVVKRAAGDRSTDSLVLLALCPFCMLALSTSRAAAVHSGTPPLGFSLVHKLS